MAATFSAVNSVLLLDGRGRHTAAAAETLTHPRHATADAMKRVEEKISRRVFYTPLERSPRLQRLRDEGRLHVVSAFNLQMADFLVPNPTHFDQLRPAKRRLLEVWCNVGSYYCGTKPWRTQGAADRESGGFVESEMLLRTDGVPVGIRLILGYLRPLSTALFSTMEANATTAANKAAGIAATAVRARKPRRKAAGEGGGDEEDGEAEEAPAPARKRKRTLTVPAGGGVPVIQEAAAAAAAAEPPRPRARHASEDEEDSVANLLDGMLNDADPWGANGPLVAGFRLHALEGMYITALYTAMTATDVIRIFGKGVPKHFHTDYEYLRVQQVRHFFNECVVPYYDRDTESTPSDTRRLRERIRRAYLPDDHEALPFMAGLFTMGDAFVYNVPPDVAPEFIDPAQYYERRQELRGVRRAQHVEDEGRYAATSLDDFVVALQTSAPWLMGANARFPTRFPHEEACSVFAHDILLPEILHDRPLPFPLGRALDAADMASTVEVLVGNNTSLFARLMIEVSQFSHRSADDPVGRDLVGENIVQQYLMGGDTGPTAPSVLREYMASYEDVAHAQHEQAVATVVAEQLQHPERVMEYVTRRERSFRMAMAAAFGRFSSGRYPRLLSAHDTLGTEGGATAADQQAVDREVLYIMRPAGEDGDDEDSTYTGQAGESRARLLAQRPDLPRDLPIVDAMGDESAGAGRGRDAAQSPLLQAALRFKGEAGSCASIPDGILSQTVLWQLKVINRMERTRLQKNQAARGLLNTPEQRVAFASEMRALMDTQMARAHETFLTTKEESEGLLRARNSALIAFARLEGGLPPVMTCVNGSVFQSAMTWVDATIGAVADVNHSTRPAILQTYFATKDVHRRPDLGSGRLHLCSLMGGDNSTGKSFTLDQIVFWHLAGTVTRTTRISPQAFMDGKLHEGVIVSDEVDPAMIKEDNNGKDKSGNSQAASFLKQQMTEFLQEAFILETDKDTGKRVGRRYVSLTSNVFHFALNWPLSDIADAMRSRFCIVEFAGSAQSGEAAGSRYRPDSLKATSRLLETQWQHHLVHGIYVFLGAQLTADTIPGGIISDMGTLLIHRIADSLRRDFFFAANAVTKRLLQFIEEMTKILATYTGAWALLYTEPGHAYLKRTGYAPYDWRVLRDFIIPNCTVGAEHVIFAIGLYAHQFRSPHEHDIMMTIAHELSIAKPHLRNPLSVLQSDLAGDVATQIELGIRTHVPASHLPEAPPAFGADMPAPAPVPVRNILTLMGGGAGRRAPDMVGSDHRYLMVKVVLSEFYTKIAAQILDRSGVKIRTTFIEHIINNYKRTQIESPYYSHDENTKELTVVRDSEDVERMDSIPVVIIKSIINDPTAKNHVQLCFAIAFFNRVHQFAVAQGDDERIKRSLAAHLLQTEEVNIIMRRMVMSPLERMRLTVVRAEEVDEKFATAWTRPDAADPVVRAISMALGNRAFRRTRPVAPGPDTSLRTLAEEAAQEALMPAVDSFLLLFPPRSFMLSYPCNGRRETMRVNMGGLFSLLEVRRNDDIALPSFPNLGRPGLTGRRQVNASFGQANRWTGAPDPFVVFLDAKGSYLDMDPGAIDAIVREQKSGFPKHGIMLKLAQWAGCDPNVPWSYGPNFNRLYKALYLRRAAADRARRPAEFAKLEDTDPRLCVDRVARYPREDMVRLVQDLCVMQAESRSGRFHHMQPMTRLLIEPVAQPERGPGSGADLNATTATYTEEALASVLDEIAGPEVPIFASSVGALFDAVGGGEDAMDLEDDG